MKYCSTINCSINIKTSDIPNRGEKRRRNYKIHPKLKRVDSAF